MNSQKNNDVQQSIYTINNANNINRRLLTLHVVHEGRVVNSLCGNHQHITFLKLKVSLPLCVTHPVVHLHLPFVTVLCFLWPKVWIDQNSTRGNDVFSPPSPSE